MHVLPGDPAELMLAGAEGGAITPERLAELQQRDGPQRSAGRPVPALPRRCASSAISARRSASASPVTELILDRFALDARAGARRPRCRARDRRAARHDRGGAPEQLGRRRSRWRVAYVGASMPVYWLGLRPDPALLLQPRLVPAGRRRRTGARSCCRPSRSASSRPALISRLIRSSMIEVLARGLHPHRPRQGPDRAPRALAPRAEERADPGRHHGRPSVRRACSPARS